MLGRVSTHLRVETGPPTSGGFGELVTDPSNFAVLRVPPLQALDDRCWTLSCREPFLTLSTSRGVTMVWCESRRFLHTGDPLDLIDRVLERLRPRSSLGLPFEGGLVGFLGYEFLDNAAVDRADGPDAWLAFPGRFRITAETGSGLEVSVLELPSSSVLASEFGWKQTELFDGAGRHPGTQACSSSTHPTDVPTRLDVRARFVAAVESCRRFIASGEIYQANLCHQLEARGRYDARALAAAAWIRNPMPHQVFVDCGEVQVVGTSPELFLRCRDGRIAVRPIKGTRPRGASTVEDECLRDELAADPKEAAEHVMIVDLERNDLGRIARTGSVKVPELMTTETFGTVHHLVSTVTAERRSDATVGDVLRATFPCGSVTGAPKIRAREVIRALEDEPRGIYTGATGFLDCRGDLELAVAIRTAVVTRSAVRYGVGAGIVTDSIAENEWNETLLKSSGFAATLSELGNGTLGFPARVDPDSGEVTT